MDGAPSSLLPGEAFDVKVRVTNLSGHKFPAGYAESRRAWVAVALVDPHDHESEPVFLAGGYDAATGHIQEEPKTRVYRAQHGRWNGQAGEAEEHIALHDMVLSDSRIPPKGFVPSITTMPLGEIDFKDGGGGYRDYDEATFSLTAPAGLTGAFILSARVYYQSMTREYAEFLRDANTTSSHGEALYAIYEATGEAPPILVASANLPVTFGGEGGGGGTGGGGGDGSGGAGGAGGLSGSGGGPDEPSGCDCRGAAQGARSPGFGAALGAILVLGLSAARRNRRRN
jgi:MYXO-CTERM domain-containing protein